MTRRLMLAGFLLAGCVFPSEGKPFDEMVGPIVTNECAAPVLAAIGESLAAVERNIRENPITIRPGARSKIAFLLDQEPNPQSLFFLVGLDADNAAMHEIQTSDVHGAAVDFVFEADCMSLTKA